MLAAYSLHQHLMKFHQHASAELPIVRLLPTQVDRSKVVCYFLIVFVSVRCSRHGFDQSQLFEVRLCSLDSTRRLSLTSNERLDKQVWIWQKDS